MNKTIAVLIAAGVTALTMTALGTAAIAIFADDPATAQAQATPVAITVSPGVDYAKREAQYQALLKQANERIQQADVRLKEANARIEQANSRIQQLQSTATAASAAQTNPSQQTIANAAGEHEAEANESESNEGNDAAAAITPQQAARIALRAARGTHLMQTPSLVNVDGRTVYQVLLDAGTLYLDSRSGEILAAVPNE